ncbi:MAG: hypothetical protein ABEH38_02325 [Flavobacteriales bacterium]
MFKVLMMMIASLGLIDQGPQEDPNNGDGKNPVEVSSKSASIGPNTSPDPEDDSDDSKHSTKEGL